MFVVLLLCYHDHVFVVDDCVCFSLIEYLGKSKYLSASFCVVKGYI